MAQAFTKSMKLNLSSMLAEMKRPVTSGSGLLVGTFESLRVRGHVI